MRISDWSSDVCSSDLVLYQEVADRLRAMIQARELEAGEWIDEVALTKTLGISRTPLREALKVLVAEGLLRLEPRRGFYGIGRASCRESVLQYGEISGGAVSLKKKNMHKIIVQL